ncbi:MAG: sialidase family protein [Puia sp.]|nr:sialidase family protein [Puia sp.]
MMLSQRILILACLFSSLLHFAAAGWSVPKVFYHADTKLDLADSFRDPTTGFIHILAQVNYTHNYYMLLTPEGTVSSIYRLPGESVVTTGLKISGRGNGKALYIAFANAVGRILFLESEDHGATWSSPVRVNNKTANTFGTIRCVAETGRVYMVYRRGSDYRQAEGLVFISRPDGSKVFSPEKVIANPKGVFSIDSAYTWANGRVVLHVLYVDVNALMYMKSEDNGVTWSPAQDLETRSVMDMRVVSSPALSSALFVFYAKTMNQIGMLCTRDQGRTFTDEAVFPGRLYFLTAQICGTKSAKLLVTAVKGGSYTLWSGWEQQGHEINKESVSTPFAEEYGALACMSGNEESTVKVGMLGRVKGSEKDYAIAINTMTSA